MHKQLSRYLFGISLLVLLIASCRPKEVPVLPSGRISLNFRTVFDEGFQDRPVIMGEKDAPFIIGDDSVYFEEFRFFISNVALEAESTKDLTAIISDDEVLLVDLSDRNNPERAAVGKTYSFPIQLGKYKGVYMDYGVPPELNIDSFDPNRYGGDNDLNNSERHAPSFDSYIFVEIKGQVLNTLTPFHYILASDALYKSSEFYQSDVFIEDENDRVDFDFVIDLKKVLEGVPVSGKFRNMPSDTDFSRDLMNSFVNESILLE